MFKKCFVVVLMLIIGISVVADDTAINDIIYGTAQSSKVKNSSKARQYRSNAKNLNTKTTVNQTAPVEVQRAEKEKISMEKDLKKIYLDLSTAYEKNEQVKINRLELLVWKIKEQIKIVDEKISLAYQINEFRKALKDFPNSDSMKKLVKDASDESAHYIDLAKEILVLKEKQKVIQIDLEQKQSEAQIIRQQEILKNMQNKYSKKYGE